MSNGFVYLIGAGPGDPGLITDSAINIIKRADIVVYDRLVDTELLSFAKGDTSLIDVGKIPGHPGNRQEDINTLLIDLASKGNCVARLKGGDPFVFGRGGEEAIALRSNGIPYQIVPGITSAIAAPAYAGIPVTHRKISSMFTVVTGSEDPDKENSQIKWNLLSKLDGTLIILMGAAHLRNIVSSLVNSGKPIETPVAVIQWGTEPYQKTITGTLDNIIDLFNENNLGPPVVTVIGDVVNLRESLSWFENRPLFGKKVLVTRSRKQASTLVTRLREMGAITLEFPTIEIQPTKSFLEIDQQVQNISKYDWLIFTSSNAVQSIFDRLDALNLDSRSLYGIKIAAIGSSTTSSLANQGIKADFMPKEFQSKSILLSMSTMNMQGANILLPKADIAPDSLAKGLSELGALVEEISVYKTSPPTNARVEALQLFEKGIDVVTFTSSSTVKNLIQILGDDTDILRKSIIACIGPVTADAATELGLKVDITASEYTVEGLARSVENYFANSL